MQGSRALGLDSQRLRAALRSRRLHICHSLESLPAIQTGSRARNMPKLRRQEVQLQPPTTTCRFKVLQWNILADGLAQNGDFVKVSCNDLCVPLPVLTWTKDIACSIACANQAILQCCCCCWAWRGDELFLTRELLAHSAKPRACTLCSAGSSRGIDLGVQEALGATGDTRVASRHNLPAGTEPLWCVPYITGPCYGKVQLV